MSKSIRVLFQSRTDLFKKRGGDTVQILETQQALKKLGLIVNVSTELSPDLTHYDIVHIFNLDWVSEPYIQVKNALKYNKKIVLSPIHHSLKEYKLYENKNRYGLMVIGNFLIPNQPLRDTFRNLVKAFINPKYKFKGFVYQLFTGIRYQQKFCLKNADIVIVQTNLEAKDLVNDYKTSSFKWKKVVNGVNASKFSNSTPLLAYKKLGFNNYIYSVGRIEPRKNQLSLIKAFRLLKNRNPKYNNLHLVFSGGFNSIHSTYVYKFKKQVKNNSDIHYTGFLSQQDLANYYSGAKVFAVPSWFETTGLVYLEAALAGSKSILASGNRAKEYLNDNAVYAKPFDIEDIYLNLDKALTTNTVKPSFPSYIKQKYTWDNAAKDILNIYEHLID